jgi:hypothetical protein
MKFVKIFGVIALLALNACGGGGGESESRSDPEQPYFEKQTDANCAIHAVNNAFGGSFLSSDGYDQYINLTVAQKTGVIPDDNFYIGGFFLGEYTFTHEQQLALKKYYDPNTPGDLASRRATLEQEFDAHQDAVFPIEWAIFSWDVGIFGGSKTIENVLAVIDILHNLKLDLTRHHQDLNTVVAELPQDFVDAKRLIVTTRSDGGHFYALRKLDGIWYKLESAIDAPEKLSGNHIDWAKTQASAKARVLYFTADEEARIKRAAAKLPTNL